MLVGQPLSVLGLVDTEDLGAVLVADDRVLGENARAHSEPPEQVGQVGVCVHVSSSPGGSGGQNDGVADSCTTMTVGSGVRTEMSKPYP